MRRQGLTGGGGERSRSAAGTSESYVGAVVGDLLDERAELGEQVPVDEFAGDGQRLR